MYLYSSYLGLKRGPYRGTLRPKYLLYGYMDPYGYIKGCALQLVKDLLRSSQVRRPPTSCINPETLNPKTLKPETLKP